MKNTNNLPKLGLVIAGPGAGKTECLCQNVLYGIGKAVENRPAQETADQAAIDALRSYLLITFTEAGATEMKDRLTIRLKTQGVMVNGKKLLVMASTDDVNAMTFNSFAFDIDKPYWQELGYAKPLSVIQGADPDRGALIEELLTDYPVSGLKYDNAASRGGAILFCEQAFDVIKAQKLQDLGDADMGQELSVALWSDDKTRKGQQQPDWAGLVSLFHKYEDKLKDSGLMEFADQEPAAIKLMDAHPDLIGSLGYRHVVADEFQDSSPIQMEFMRRFANCPEIESVMAVGDDFQSIFGFRDADPDNMLHFFERIGREGTTMMLTENYRSTPEIVEMGNRTIERNVNKVDKTITATRPSGKPVEIKPFYREKTELRYIAARIKVLIDNGVAPEDIAFISYRRATVRKVASLLQEFDVPVVVKVPTSVAEDPNVQAVEALSKAFEDPNATELYLQYLVAKYEGHLYADDRDRDAIEAEIESLKKTFNWLPDQDFDTQKGIFNGLVNELNPKDEVFDHFRQKCMQFDDFIDEIGWIDKFARFGQSEEIKLNQEYVGVTLTTAHSSKGLEWKYVFCSISDFDNRVINKKRSSDPEVEEIRRLEFVAFTRARDELFVSGTYEAWNEPKKDDSGKTVGRDIGYNRFLKEVLEDNDIDYVPDDPMEPLRLKHAAEVRKANAAKAAEKRKANAAKKDIIKLARLEAKLKAGRILTTYETLDLNKLRKKYPGGKLVSEKTA